MGHAFIGLGLMVRLLAVVALIVLGTAPHCWADPRGEVGGNWFGVSDTHSVAGSGGTPISVETETSSAETPEIRYTERLACGDTNSNMQLDSYACESTLMRCGTGDRGFIYYATAHLPDGSSEAAGTGCYLPQEIAAASGAAVAAPPRITPALVLRAFERVPLPESEVVVQPPRRRGSPRR